MTHEGSDKDLGNNRPANDDEEAWEARGIKGDSQPRERLKRDGAGRRPAGVSSHLRPELGSVVLGASAERDACVCVESRVQ